MPELEFHASIRQFGRSLPTLAGLAEAAGRAGFQGISIGDHLSHPPPLNLPTYESMSTATWIAAHVPSIKIGHLCLCGSFRHPAVLAKAAVTIDHASGGRFELGLGAGSNPQELAEFGVSEYSAKDRTSHLEETIQVIRALWSGQEVDFAGQYHRIDGGRHEPVPLTTIPIIVGGSGRSTRAIAAKHADWWNLLTADTPLWPEGLHPDADAIIRLREDVYPAKMSVLQLVYLAESEQEREQAPAALAERLGSSVGAVIGTGNELIDYFGLLGECSVERAYISLLNRHPEEALERFGDKVVHAITPNHASG